MNPNISFKDLLEKQVSRREFLMHLGVSLLAIVGLSAFLKNVTGSLDVNKPKPKATSYGESAYSGTSKK